MPSPKSLLGYYTGSCTTTSGKRPVVSKLELSIVTQDSVGVIGKLTTKGDVEIDVEFRSKHESGRLIFTSAIPEQKINIEWSANCGNSGIIEGRFYLVNSGLLAKVFGYHHQSGTWICKRRHSISYLNFKKSVQSFISGMVGLLFLFACVGGIGYGIYQAYIYNPPPPFVPAVARSTPLPTQDTDTAPIAQAYVPNNYNYSYYSTPVPTPTSKIGQFLSDPMVQQGVTEAISAWMNGGQGNQGAQPVHVQSYTRSDGTQVQQYNRALPNQGR